MFCPIKLGAGALVVMGLVLSTPAHAAPGIVLHGVCHGAVGPPALCSPAGNAVCQWGDGNNSYCQTPYVAGKTDSVGAVIDRKGTVAPKATIAPKASSK